MIDNNGATALLYAADYTSPEGVGVLLQWGADPMKEVEMKVFMYVGNDTIGHHEILGRQQIPIKVTPYEFCLYQILSSHIRNNAVLNEMPAGNITMSMALPLASGHDGQKRERILGQFRTLAALSSHESGSSQTLAEQILEKDTLSNFGIKGLIPRTKNKSVEVNTNIDGDVYFDIWGFYMWQGYKISMHVGLNNELSKDETNSKILSHISQGAPVIAYQTMKDHEHFYRLQIEHMPVSPSGEEGNEHESITATEIKEPYMSKDGLGPLSRVIQEVSKGKESSQSEAGPVSETHASNTIALSKMLEAMGFQYNENYGGSGGTEQIRRLIEMIELEMGEGESERQ